MLKELKEKLSLSIKKRVLDHYLIPYSNHGVPESIVKYITNIKPLYLVDIGASRGTFTEAIDLEYGIEKSLLIEPQPQLADILKSKFLHDKYKVYQCAVGDSARTVEMEILNWDYSSSLLPVKRNIPDISKLDLSKAETITCTIKTLDEIMNEISWSEQIDLLKIDTQGYELLAFQGAEETLKRTKMIFTEVSFIQMYDDSPLFQEIYDYLRAKGFKLLTISDGFRDSRGSLLQADALFSV
jgi:FkbM family methyltransferase